MARSHSQAGHDKCSFLFPGKGIERGIKKKKRKEKKGKGGMCVLWLFGNKGRHFLGKSCGYGTTLGFRHEVHSYQERLSPEAGKCTEDSSVLHLRVLFIQSVVTGFLFL
jgi:hypothetical protein